MSTLVSEFAAQVAAHGDRLALADRGRTWTYDQLNRAANRVTHGILDKHPPGDDPVAILLGQSAEGVIAMLGVAKAGRPYLILDAAAPAARQQQILDHSGAVLVLDNVDPGSDDETDPRVDIHEDDVAHIYYTSGSTGEPKGVVGLHGVATARTAFYQSIGPVDPTDRIAATYDLSFGASRGSVHVGLLSGACVHLHDLRHEGIAGFAAWLEEERITYARMMPSVMRAIVENLPEGEYLPDLDTLWLSGEALYRRDVELVRSKLSRDCRIVTAYAATETGPNAGVEVGDELAGNPFPVGRPVPGKEILILDPDDTGVGEIAVRSRHLAAGYWRQPELTEKAFTSDPDDPRLRTFRTGDLGRFRPDGLLEFHGRRDARVKIRGFSLDLTEIERAIKEAAPVREVATIVGRAPWNRERLIAYVVPETNPPPSVTALRNAVSRLLPAYMLPPLFVIVDALPRSDRGKVDRKALPPPPEERPKLDVDYVPPRDDLERTIARAWERTLGFQPVGIHDRFDELGGDSLAVLALVVAVGEELGEELPVSVMLEAATVAELAEVLREDRSQVFSPVVPLRARGSRPPFFCVHGGDGDLFFLRPIALALDRDQPTYGLQVTGAEGRRALHSVPALAARYVEAIRTVQPHGPYVVGGYSSGGVVAYEMAQQLAAAGDRPALVVLLDADTPSLAYGGTERMRRRKMLDRQPRLGRWQHRAKLVARDAAFWALAISRRDAPLTRWRIKYRMYAERRAINSYRVEPYPGRVVLCRASEEHRGYPEGHGWADLVTGRFDIVDIPGTHQSMIYQPSVEVLGRTLDPVIADAVGATALTPAQRSATGVGGS